MMGLEQQILAAMALDLLFGDPRWLPHPVRLIGSFASRCEAPSRRFLPARAAGVLTVAATLAATAGATVALLGLARALHPLVHDGVSVLLLYTTLAARDLARHALDVRRALEANDLTEARRCVSLLVGRETSDLDEAEIARGAVESVAENTVDGVTAPLFFAILMGPLGAMVYKAVNTLDSTFGYRNHRYFRFGWASARLDDLVNYVPARLTAPIIVLCAWLLRLDARGALTVLRRDARKHPSPNAGLTEAAMAGALGVQLGGDNRYGDELHSRARLGDPRTPLSRLTILPAVILMWASCAAAAALFFAGRIAAVQVLHG